MGSQQMKAGNEQMPLNLYEKEYMNVQKGSKSQTSKPTLHNQSSKINVKSIMSSENLPLVSYPKQNITVANFAKAETMCLFVKDSQTEVVVNDDTVAGTSKKHIKCEDVEICDATNDILEVEVNTSKENSLKLSSFHKTTNSEINTELVEPHGVEGKLEIVIPVGVILECDTVRPITIDSNSESFNKSLSTLKNNTAEADSLKKEIKYEELDIDTINESLGAEVNTCDSIAEQDCKDYRLIQKSINIQVKKELLEPRGVDSSWETVNQVDNTSQNDIIITLNDDYNTKSDSYSTIKTETMDGIQFSENLQNMARDDNINPEFIKNRKLVKNPLAFLKKNNGISLIKYRMMSRHAINQENCLNDDIKAEPVDGGEVATPAILEAPKTAYDNMTILQEEMDQSLISRNEFVIKSESIADDNQEIYKSTISKINCLNYNSSSSLDVNISTEDTDFDEATSKQYIDDVKSNLSIYNTAEYSKNFSIIEMSSKENDFQITESVRTPKKPIKKLRNSKKLEKMQKQSKPHFKTVDRKPKSKRTQSRKCSDADYSYRFIYSTKSIPKSDIKTRKQQSKSIAEETNPTSAKDDFPKPLKHELASLQKECAVATELPKPMMMPKTELDINIKNKRSYLKPEFQPSVRLKRIESEKLLIPLKAKNVRRTSKFKRKPNATKRLKCHQMATNNRSDLLIQRAYSLNACNKLNRSSSNHDHSNCNGQCECLMTSSSRVTNTPNESFTETESKYFSPQELFHSSLFHSSTPDASSRFSERIDRGVSTSTPSTHHYTFDCNKTLLLKIAAERAFINNHLIHFGYSPIQFDSYNNPNDLSVFLKYLLGNVNTN